MKNTSTTRIEYDSLGEVFVPFNALYGAQTQPAIENFPYQIPQMAENNTPQPMDVAGEYVA
jgi:fumarate hydratase class II